MLASFYPSAIIMLFPLFGFNVALPTLNSKPWKLKWCSNSHVQPVVSQALFNQSTCCWFGQAFPNSSCDWLHRTIPELIRQAHPTNWLLLWLDGACPNQWSNMAVWAPLEPSCLTGQSWKYKRLRSTSRPRKTIWRTFPKERKNKSDDEEENDEHI
jgi:hypothetical protein